MKLDNNELIKPTRPRRAMKSPHNERFTDREKILQPDGRTAVFQWAFGQDGWEFCHFRDSQGFTFIEDIDQTGEYSKRLTNCEIDISAVKYRTETPQIGDNETLHAYRYGGALSMRMGWYITPKDDNKKVLRTKLIAMS